MLGGASKAVNIKPLGFGFPYNSRVLCLSIMDDLNQLRIIISGENEPSNICLRFIDLVAYRSVDEGDYLRTLGEMDGLPRVSFYEAYQSEFVEWYHGESLDIRRGQPVRHFILATENNCIDILCYSMPHIERIAT